MLYIIGLGLGDERDITLRGLDAIKTCERIYLESYTSILPSTNTEAMEQLYNHKIIIADRELVEGDSDSILLNADLVNIAFLVVGDPFGATTHHDLISRACDLGVEVKCIHNTSIMNAIGACGLSLYNYGQTISICFFTETWQPDSFYDRIKLNLSMGAHTLCLLDIKVKEQSIENMARGRMIYEPSRFMTINQCIDQLLLIEEKRGEGIYSSTSLGVGVARLGSEDQCLKSGTFEELKNFDFGGVLHSFIIVGKMHCLEQEILKGFSINQAAFI